MYVNNIKRFYEAELYGVKFVYVCDTGKVKRGCCMLIAGESVYVFDSYMFE